MNDPEPLESRPVELSAFCEEIRDLLPAAALDALPWDEAAFVERHTESCTECAAELESLRSVSGALALAVPLTPPPDSLKRSLMAQVAADGSGGGPTPMRPGRPRMISPVWGAIAASVVVSAGSLFWASNLQGQLNRVQGRADRYDQVVKVLASDQLNTRSLQAVNTGNHYYGTLYLDPSSKMGMVTVRGLPDVPGDRAWQAWFVRANGERVSGGMLRTDPSGSCYAVIELPPNPESFVAFGITEEPAGGSSTPTGPRIMSASLS